MNTHILGFPRIGKRRELKWALEKYWKEKISEQELKEIANEIKLNNWSIQASTGLDYVSTGDFSYYDHVLDMALAVGLYPKRFEGLSSFNDYFTFARGSQADNIAPLEMTKWFDTNYHFLVPEIDQLDLRSQFTHHVIEDSRHAFELGYKPKPVIVGPMTLLYLAKSELDKWQLLDNVVNYYKTLLSSLADYTDLIQVDEPILVLDLDDELVSLFKAVYKEISTLDINASILLATYYESINDNIDLINGLPIKYLHVDLCRGGSDIQVLGDIREDIDLSLGIIDGRNIWKNNYQDSLALINQVKTLRGKDCSFIASSCSLLHSPVDLESEDKLPTEIQSWMAFAVQKCQELKDLKALHAGKNESILITNSKIHANRQKAKGVYQQAIRDLVESCKSAELGRKSDFNKRQVLQEASLKLPLLPTTTIGSFPQTQMIRKIRRLHKNGDLNESAYKALIKEELQSTIAIQEDLDLDVLVHGEAERNDMVEYFGEQLNGFCFSNYGWVQSYGSRCVKPPIIYGDVSRAKDMTIEWIKYAQSLTDKPVKAMLTGPVTILNWSFVRDDLPRQDVCWQIALAIGDEVKGLESEGIKIIQIDEAALREGLPLKRSKHEHYLTWAIDAFRISCTGLADETQIHTHMCYSEFNSIIDYISRMDADVISIESSRSHMNLLDVFQQFDYPNDIGPGVYDIHSPRIPDTSEMESLLRKALSYIPKERLWVNPDCGLKTRAWKETKASLKNMIEARNNILATL